MDKVERIKQARANAADDIVRNIAAVKGDAYAHAVVVIFNLMNALAMTSCASDVDDVRSDLVASATAAACELIIEGLCKGKPDTQNATAGEIQAAVKAMFAQQDALNSEVNNKGER